MLSAAAIGALACSPKVRNYGGATDDIGEGGGGADAEGGGGSGAAGGGSGAAGGGGSGGDATGGGGSDAAGGGGSGGDGGGETTAPPGQFHWALQIGENGFDSAVSVAVDPEGNPIVIGRFAGAIDLGGGPLTAGQGSGAYLVKYDREGKHLWSKSFGLSLSGGQHVATGSRGELFVGGSYFRDLDFGGGPLPVSNGGLGLARFAGADGAHVWSKGFGDQYVKELRYVAVDNTGAVLISGSIGGTADFGGGPVGDDLSGNAVYLAKLDAKGNHVFTTYIDDERAHLAAGGVAADAEGNVAIAGAFEENLWLGVVRRPLVSNGGKDIFVGKLSPQGTVLWRRSFGDSLADAASQVAFDPKGNVLLGGTFQGSVDFGGGPLVALGTRPNFFVAKFDPEGNHLYSRGFGDSELQDVASVASDPAGNAVITGTFLGNIDFDGAVLTSKGTTADVQGYRQGGDIFIAKLGRAGEHLWSRHIGDPEMQLAGGVAVGPEGEVFAVGSFRGTVDLGGGPVTSRGETDGYLVKLGP
ncbi:uncharacterized protein SOCEGT47_024950 [Sorangium cellulosum]|uniref:Uncharacterized protein n=2 Tax=Sorangium cellulosum TaxID=56 RepID=A0A4P2PYP9_SORCE|nr:uncharacterized protein SOCEGT47_024950 [Sorangium cellulosum]